MVMLSGRVVDGFTTILAGELVHTHTHTHTYIYIYIYIFFSVFFFLLTT